MDTTSQKPLIQSLWVGNKLSQMELLCLNSFVFHGHPFDLYCYEPLDNIPEGVNLKDANQIIHESKVFKYIDRDTYSGFANLFRYTLLAQKGGIWVDTDVICMKPLEFPNDYMFATEHGGLITNCVIQVPRNSPLMQATLAQAEIFDTNNMTWGQIGPGFFDGLVRQHDLARFAVGADAFCPIHYPSYAAYLSADGMQTHKDVIDKAYGLHLWNEMWRRKKVDKNQTFSSTSIFEILKKRYMT